MSPAQPTGVPDVALAPALRDALTAATYTYDAVGDLLGTTAQLALARNETTPALRRTTHGSPLETLVRLFLLQTEVDRAHADRALPGLVDALVRGGMLVASGGEVRALLDCRPYADDDHDWWVVSDLTPGLDGQLIRVAPDHVLGVSPASTSLAQLTVREPVARALDLGTGCGVQALHLSGHAGEVVATDVNPRALAVTAFNAALNDVRIDVRDGSLWEPVGDERFDLVTTNPPFVISPATAERLVYRDSGLPGDQVVEAIVRGAPAHLTDGGWCQVLANWAIASDRRWDDRLAEWLDPGCDALVVQREVLDPASYVELWLRDAGRHSTPGYLEAYDAWLGWFESQGIEGIGFGWINLRRGGSARELLDWPHAVEQPIASAIRDWGRAVRVEVGLDDRLVTRADVQQETVGAPGAEDPETIVLRQQTGLRRARRVDTVEAALVGACDGELTVGQILDAVAHLLERDRGGAPHGVPPGRARARHRGLPGSGRLSRCHSSRNSREREGSVGGRRSRQVCRKRRPLEVRMLLTRRSLTLGTVAGAAVATLAPEGLLPTAAASPACSVRQPAGRAGLGTHRVPHGLHRHRDAHPGRRTGPGLRLRGHAPGSEQVRPCPRQLGHGRGGHRGPRRPGALLPRSGRTARGRPGDQPRRHRPRLAQQGRADRGEGGGPHAREPRG